MDPKVEALMDYVCAQLEITEKQPLPKSFRQMDLEPAFQAGLRNRILGMFFRERNSFPTVQEAKTWLFEYLTDKASYGLNASNASYLHTGIYMEWVRTIAEFIRELESEKLLPPAKQFLS